MSEHHAQNVARGHKATISNPDVSEEAKDHSRRMLEEIEGSADPSIFTASVGSKKAGGYSSERATQAVEANEKSKERTNAPSKLYPDGFDSEWVNEAHHVHSSRSM